MQPLGECYICLEQTNALSPCNCNSYLCVNCLEKLRIYEYKICTVCRIALPFYVEEEIVLHKPKELPCLYYFIPFHCRPVRYRYMKRYVLVELLFHLAAMASLLLLFSCVIMNVDQCYTVNLFIFFFPCMIIYSSCLFVLNSLCQ